ncbi:MAG: phosphatidylglycerophosphatase A [Magnetospirillum sp. WYHS-4]
MIEPGFSNSSPATLLATWFGVGRLPGAPGTWGSLASLPLAWSLAAWAGPWGLAAGVATVFVAGIWAAGAYMRATGTDDPGAVVIDEVAGQGLALLAVAPDPLLYLIGFALFRLFDILKPWPVSWADREVGGGLGVMLDDMLAGLYAGAALYGIAWGLA